MRLVWRLASFVAAICLIAYFVWYLTQHLDVHGVVAALASPAVLAALVLASLCCALVYPATGWAWRQLLLRKGEHWSSLDLGRIIGLTQLAKYLPGNIAQHATRAALALKSGMPVRSYVSSVFQETILAVAASAIVGTAFIAISAVSGGIADGLLPHRWALLLVCAMCIACVGVALMDFSPGAAPEGLISRWADKLGGLPGPVAGSRAFVVYTANYLVIGGGIWAIAQAMGLASVDYGLATAAFALSWIVGFVVPGAPAGLGAREGTMVLILQHQGPSDQIALLVLLSRAASMLGDLAVFLIAISLARTTNGVANDDRT
jgi:hypothetical protein